MVSYPPARIGDRVQEVETPALLLDLAVAERNIVRLQEITAATRARPRPHAKSHKCPNLARLQIAHGAVGVCCQKVSEAVALVDAGVADVLVANQIVDPAKIGRLAALARRARIAVCVDQPRNVADLSAAARAADVELAVLVEIEVGMQRCGVAPGAPVVELARQVDGAANLRFAGLQAYHGSIQHLPLPEERRQRQGRSRCWSATPSPPWPPRVWRVQRCPAAAAAPAGTTRRAVRLPRFRPARTS